MKRHQRHEDGTYHINGQKYDLLEGSRAQVMHGTAYKTTGGLKKANLLQNKHGRIVSKKKHNTAKREKRLQKHGYTAKKGKFGAVKINSKSRKNSRRSSRKNRSRRSSRKNQQGGNPVTELVNSVKDVFNTSTECPSKTVEPTPQKGGMSCNKH